LGWASRRGGFGVLISKLRTALGVAILIVATAAISAIVASKWNLFPPTDYEDCAARAAKDAKSKDALSVLLSLCDSEFKGRRKPGGGYAYYSSCRGLGLDLGRTFDIKGPNPTADERKRMTDQCWADINEEQRAADQQAEAERRAAEQRAEAARRRADQEAEAARKAQLAAAYQAAQEHAAAAAAASALQLRKSQATAAVQATLNGFKCTYPRYNYGDPVEHCDEAGPVDMQVEISNRSKEALSSILIGLALRPANGACPSSFADTQQLSVRLSSGETRVYPIYMLDAAFSKHPVCIKVVDVQFAR
jgi:hypothetical protein